MTQEEKYLQWMEKFFCDEDGKTCKEILLEASNNGKLSLFVECCSIWQIGYAR